MSLPSEILEPIDGPDPAGPFLRYETSDTTYADIKEAREEEDALPQGEWERERKTADYKAVVEIATETLVERSKDLQIAAWLTEALTHREGFAGLRDGLQLVHDLLDRFWDDVKPPLDEDGDAGFRASAVAWIGARLDDAVRAVPLTRDGFSFVDHRVSRKVGYEKDAEGDDQKMRARRDAIESGRPTAEDFDESVDGTPKSWYKELVSDLDGAEEALDALEALSDERFGRDAPSFRTLRGALDEVGVVARRILDQKLEEEPDEPEAPDVLAGDSEEGAGEAGEESSTGGGGSGGGQSPGGAAAGSVSADPTSWEDAGTRVAAAARYMRSEDPTNPAPYLLLRGFRWGEIRSGEDELDPRLLSAPPTRTRTKLKELLLDARWEDLLEAAEEVMATAYGRGWLDLQRYVLTACDGLAGPYDGVSDAIREELRTLLRDRPELPDLTLMDDSPTANPETRAWLQDEGLLEDDEGEDGAAERARRRREPRRPGRDVSQRARDRVRAGAPREGIEILMKQAKQEESARARFLLQSQAARIMVESGLESVAMPILNEMLQEIERHDLEAWEDGETVALPMALLYRCMEALDADPHTREQLYERVCRLDPVQAMKFGAGGDGAPAVPDAPDEAPAETVDGAE